MDKLEEYYKFLDRYEGLACYDVEHAIDHFHLRFPNLEEKIFYKVLKDGINKINKVYGGKQGQYSIISTSTNIKIPLHIKEDQKEQGRVIGAISTTLDRINQPFDKFNSQKVYVEHKQSDYTKSDKPIDLFEEENYTTIEVE